MNIRFIGKFKSITPFEWLNIPKFAIITGRNGAGKSQLLDLLYNRMIIDINYQSQDPLIKELIFENEQINRNEVTYLKAEWTLTNPQNVDLSFFLTKTNEMFSQFQQFQQIHSRSHLSQTRIRQFEAFKKLEMKVGTGISIDQFQKEFPELLSENETELGQKIAEIFYDYRLKEIQLLSEGKTSAEVNTELGEKPWVVLSEIIKGAKLPFEFNNPSELKIRDAFQFKLFKTPTKENIFLHDLSSGEKVIFSLIFLLYNSREKKFFPKIMLLDEPDAHLHPSMSNQLLNVLKNVLVDKFNVRVIMTTHSPSTVVMSPEESLFEMSHTEPRITKAKSKNDAVSLLTEGLVYVGEGTKYFIVEDTDDVDFYNHIYSTSTAEGAIEREIPMVFIAASTSTKTGGKTVVKDWVGKLQNSGIENLIQGIIDEDDENSTSVGVHKIKRYSIENYLLDPIIVYAALMDKDAHNSVIDIGLTVGEEYKLKVLNDTDLQKIADSVFGKVTPFVQGIISGFDTKVDNERMEIDFILKKKLNYPKWLLNKKGKKILNEAYGSCFGTSTINYSTLFKALRKTNFIPTELAELLDKIRR